VHRPPRFGGHVDTSKPSWHAVAWLVAALAASNATQAPSSSTQTPPASTNPTFASPLVGSFSTSVVDGPGHVDRPSPRWARASPGVTSRTCRCRAHWWRWVSRSRLTPSQRSAQRSLQALFVFGVVQRRTTDRHDPAMPPSPPVGPMRVVRDVLRPLLARPVVKYRASSRQIANRGVTCGWPSAHTVTIRNKSPRRSSSRASQKQPMTDLERRTGAIGADWRGGHRPNSQVHRHQLELEVGKHTRVHKHRRDFLMRGPSHIGHAKPPPGWMSMRVTTRRQSAD